MNVSIASTVLCFKRLGSQTWICTRLVNWMMRKKFHLDKPHLLGRNAPSGEQAVASAHWKEPAQDVQQRAKDE